MNDSLATVAASARRPSVLVVGDVILDRYVRGGIERISPESPAQVLDVTGEEEMLGGAANVAANVAALGGKALLVGVVGKDSHAATVRALLKARRIAAPGLVVDAARPTTVKTRFMALRQQMLRVDREVREGLDAALEKKIVDAVARGIAACDGVVLSDYGKGVLSRTVIARVVALARRHKKPVIVDPKGSDYARYKGCTLVTPNRKEASEASGVAIRSERDYARAAARIFGVTGAAQVLITRGDEGMSLFDPDGGPLHLPAEALEVFDVSGAGDTVVAALAAFSFAGIDLATAARLANAAASIEVAHVGAKAVTREELLSRLRSAIPHGKVFDRTGAARFAKAAREAGERVVFTNGCFDLLHAGHVDYLEKAKGLGDRLMVGLNSDASVRRLKGAARPILPQADRAKVLAALGCVDGVVVFSEQTPAALIKAVRPDILVKGGDYRPSEVVGRDTVEADGGKVVIVPLLPGRSTSDIVARIARTGGKKK